jgi:hypothetical protein
MAQVCAAPPAAIVTPVSAFADAGCGPRVESPAARANVASAAKASSAAVLHEERCIGTAWVL